MLASEIAKALDGRRVGGTWMACCPAHDDRKPSLSVTKSRDGTLLFYCHAGCDQREVIEALRSRGLWPARSRHSAHSRHFENRCVSIEPDAQSDKRQAKGACDLAGVASRQRNASGEVPGLSGSPSFVFARPPFSSPPLALSLWGHLAGDVWRS